jgi:uncharacterized metal-binding protein YceD (DUF177 family)
MHQIRIEVELLTHGPVDKDFDLPPAAFDLVDDEDFQFPDPVRGRLHANRAGESVLVTGELRTGATCTCSRCLEEVVLDLRVPFRLGFIPQDPVYPITDPEEAAKTSFSGDFVFPMEAMREEIMIALPAIPACADRAACDERKAARLALPVVDASPAPKGENHFAAQLAKARKKLQGDA